MNSFNLTAIALIAGTALTPAAHAQAGDPARGKTLFQQRCAVCHKIDGTSKSVGPNLAGVYGRKSGTAAYSYSAAMKKAALTWDAKALATFMAGPAKLMPGTKMVIAVPDPKDRANIIAYLQTLR